MADDTRLKTSYELAMERLREKDAEAGVTLRSLSEQEKAQIAELRSFYAAKVAEAEVMHQSRLQKVLDPGGREALDAEFRADKERLIAERDRKIELIRAGANP